MYDATIQKLRTYQNGAHVHIKNKALFYMRLWGEHQTPKNKLRRKQLALLCQRSLIDDDWKNVKQYLKKYF